MKEPERHTTDPPFPLDYTTSTAATGRVSKFSIMALVLSVVSSPCLLSPFSSWINWYLPDHYREPGARYSHFCIRTGFMIVATSVSVFAYARARSSRGVIGTGLARAALVISVLWWVLLVLIFIAVFLFSPHPD
jgi:hypothetical protein